MSHETSHFRDSRDPATGRRFLLGLLAAGIAWRLFLSFVFVPAWEARANVAPAPDAYPVLAHSLLHEGVLGYAPHGASPTTVRGPGFPTWLAAGMLIGGEDPRWLGFWGGLPGLLAGMGLAFLVARRFGMMGALAAGAVAVLHPLPSLIAARVMGDDFYAALGFGALVSWAFALQSTRRRAGIGWTAVAAVLLAAQMLTRSSGLLTLVAALIIGLWSGKRRPALCLMLLAAALLPPLAWSVRSSRLEQRPVFVHSLTGYNFWIGEGFDRFGAGEPPAGNYARVVRFTLEQAADPEIPVEGFWYAKLDPRRASRLDAKLTRAAVERVVSDPAGYLARVARGVGRYWFQAQTARRSLQYMGLAAPVLLLALVGACCCAGGGDRLGLLLLVTLAAHNLAYAAVLPAARLSVQVYPALAYLAGVGAARLLEKVRSLW